MPDTPEPLAPEEGTDIEEPSVTFEWSAPDGAENYELQLARDRDFDDLVFEGRVGDTTEFAYSGLPSQEGVSLFWRVRARVEGEWTGYGPTSSFVLADWQPEQPDLRPSGAGDAGEAAPVAGAAESATGPIVLITFVLITTVLTGWLYYYVDDSSPSASPANGTATSTTAPTPPPDTAESEIRQYGVVDEEDGVYRIPIDSAMKDVVQSRGGDWER